MDCDCISLYTLYGRSEARAVSYDEFDDDQESHIVFLPVKVLFNTYSTHDTDKRNWKFRIRAV